MCKHIRDVSRDSREEIVFISRSDSTLRSHFPLDVSLITNAAENERMKYDDLNQSSGSVDQLIDQGKPGRVLGQILPGVPVIALPNSHRFSGIPYVIFPGNVGSAPALAQVYRTLRPLSQ